MAHCYPTPTVHLNHSKRPSLGNRAPITAFTGLPAHNPLRTLLPAGALQPASLDFVKSQRIIHIEAIAKALDEIHRDISKRKNKLTEDAIHRQNARTHVRSINFEIGDFVLVVKRSEKQGNNLRVTWKGPRRISRVASELIFECEDFINRTHALFHANRLKLYADSKQHVSEELLDSMDHNDPHLNTVEAILNLR